MTEQNDGGPAFPPALYKRPTDGLMVPVHGMSLRDYFAAAALQGIIAGAVPLGALFEKDKPVNYAQAQAAYMIADTMLAEREKAESE